MPQGLTPQHPSTSGSRHSIWSRTSDPYVTRPACTAPQCGTCPSPSVPRPCTRASLTPTLCWSPTEERVVDLSHFLPLLCGPHRWPVAVGEEDRLFTTSCFQLMKVIICSALMNVFLSCTQTHMVGRLVWVRDSCGVFEWSSVFVSGSTVGGVLVLSPLLLLVVEVLTSAWAVKRLAQLCLAGHAYSTPDWWGSGGGSAMQYCMQGTPQRGVMHRACVCKVLVG